MGPSRRWRQISLRSFLVLVTLGGLLASWSAQRLFDLKTPGTPGDIVPTEWVAGEFDKTTDAWIRESSRNVKWVAALGSQTYSSPVVSGGKVFIGSNNIHGYLKRYPWDTDLGVMLCFDAEDGRFLWQHSNEKLPTGRVNDWPLQGVCSTPLVEGDRLWYVSNRCEVVCLDTEGFRDGENDGPFLRESHKSPDEADVVWKLDMIGQLGVFPHNMSRCDVLAVGDRLFVGTSNGMDESHIRLPSPNAPSFLCLDKNTGQVLWMDNSPGKNILHGQWGSPAYGVLGGAPQVIFPGGDGWLYSFDPAGGPGGKSKLLWKFDCNPKTSQWILGGRGTRNNILATPVIYEERVYVVVGQEPEHGEGNGHLWCIDPTRRGDVSPELVFNRADPSKPIPHKRTQACVAADGDFTRPNPNSAVIWHFDGVKPTPGKKATFEDQMHRTLGTPAIEDDLLFVADFSGFFRCLDAKTGKRHWHYDLFAASWSSPRILGEHVYIGDEDGDVAVFRLSADPDVAMTLGEPVGHTYMNSSVLSTPTAADNVLYLNSKTHLFAIEEDTAGGGR
jgi:outer membrane protein assembly factor BamB